MGVLENEHSLGPFEAAELLIDRTGVREWAASRCQSESVITSFINEKDYGQTGADFTRECPELLCARRGCWPSALITDATSPRTRGTNSVICSMGPTCKMLPILRRFTAYMCPPSHYPSIVVCRVDPVRNYCPGRNDAEAFLWVEDFSRL